MGAETAELSEMQRAWVREIAREVLEEVLPPVIAAHVNVCPWGLRLRAACWITVGACICSGVAGGVVATIVLRAIGAG